MNNDIPADDLRTLWQSQNTEAFRMSLDEMRSRVERLSWRAQRLNVFGTLIFAASIIGCLWWLTLVRAFMPRLGAILTIAGVGVTLWQTRANYLAERRATRAAVESGLVAVDFHRAQLERQRDFHRGWRFWSRLLVMLPGPLMFIAGFGLEYPHLRPIIALEVLTFFALGGVAIAMNRRAVAIYEHRLGELERMKG